VLGIVGGRARDCWGTWRTDCDGRGAIRGRICGLEDHDGGRFAAARIPEVGRAEAATGAVYTKRLIVSRDSSSNIVSARDHLVVISI
jgi:hypothetical protein